MDASSDKLRLKITTVIPSPYQVDFFNALSKRQDVDVEVLYWRQKTAHIFNLPTTFDHSSQVLSGVRVWLPFIGWEKLCLGIIPQILKRDYDLFVVCNVGPTALIATLLLSCLRLPWVYWAERQLPQSQNLFKSSLKRLWWKFVGRFSRGVFCIGEKCIEDFENLGVPRDRLPNIPYSPNLSPLLEPSDEIQMKADEIRKTLGYDETNTVFLYCGSLIRRKGVDILVHSFADCYMQNSDSRLLIIGDGAERANLEGMIAPELRAKVHFAGTIQCPELLSYYSAADVFTFPSRHDGWAVVVGEAAAAGLSLLISDKTGAGFDMVVKGETGYVFPVDDVDALSVRMKMLAGDSALRERMGANARRMAKSFSADAGAEKMVRAAKSLLKKNGRR